MGPELMLASAVIGAGSTALGAVANANAQKAQASAAKQQADIQAKWDERRAQEEVAASQREASSRLREARLLQSRLTASAGASGSRADDKTVLDLFGDIEKEGQYNARNALAAGEQAAAGLRYQGDLGRSAADANARIARYGSRATLLGGVLSAGGQLAGGVGTYRMANRYSQPSSSSYRYG